MKELAVLLNQCSYQRQNHYLHCFPFVDVNKYYHCLPHKFQMTTALYMRKGTLNINLSGGPEMMSKISI